MNDGWGLASARAFAACVREGLPPADATILATPWAGLVERFGSWLAEHAETPPQGRLSAFLSGLDDADMEQLGVTSRDWVIARCRAVDGQGDALTLLGEARAARDRREEELERRDRAEDSAERTLALSDAADLPLDDVFSFVRRFVVLGDHQAVAVVLWAAHAHAVDAAEATPYLGVTSAEKRSGKSRLLEILGLLVPGPLATANVSTAALFRIVAEPGPTTLLLDEADTFFGRRRGELREGAEDMRALLNAGHRRGAEVVRMVGQGAGMRAERFPVFCPKVVAGIGELPDTVADRSIPIRMKRKGRGEALERFRRRHVEPEAAALRARLAAWAAAHVDALVDARPELPDALDDRAQDGWEPLLAIADAAAGEWPARARGAALALSGGREAEDASTGVRLLADVRAVFEVREVDRISSADLCAALNAIEESPWGAWRDGKGIDPRTLARRLREYDVVPGTVRLSDGTTAKGYQRERFLDAWERYCPREQVPNAAAAPPDASRTSHRHNPHGDRDAAVTDGLNAGSIRHAQNPHGERDVTVCRTEGAQEGGNGSGTTNEPDPFELLRAAGLDPVEEADDGSWREVERLVDEAGLTIAVERRNGRAG